MQREVLNRTVCCDGQSFDAGTPIELIPKDNRESCSRSGWTRMEEFVEAGPGNFDGDDDDDERSSKQVIPDSNPAVIPATTPVIPETTPVIPETPLVIPTDDELTGTELELRVVDLLKAASITTKTQAREYLAANKTFRIIEGIGKASDAAIRAVLEEPKATDTESAAQSGE